MVESEPVLRTGSGQKVPAPQHWLWLGVGVGAGAGLCLEVEPEPEISKMGGSGNPGAVVG